MDDEEFYQVNQAFVDRVHDGCFATFGEATFSLVINDFLTQTPNTTEEYRYKDCHWRILKPPHLEYPYKNTIDLARGPMSFWSGSFYNLLVELEQRGYLSDRLKSLQERFANFEKKSEAV